MWYLFYLLIIIWLNAAYYLSPSESHLRSKIIETNWILFIALSKLFPLTSVIREHVEVPHVPSLDIYGWSKTNIHDYLLSHVRKTHITACLFSFFFYMSTNLSRTKLWPLFSYLLLPYLIFLQKAGISYCWKKIPNSACVVQIVKE